MAGDGIALEARRASQGAFRDRSPSPPPTRYLTDGKRHLICVPYSIEALHQMASDLGIKRCWFHRDHYDIPKTRKEEIEGKCEMISSKEIVRIARMDR